ncbi:MAG: hypothetical protein IPO45_09275 [Saprospiraceae bacterium]|nr:hypothetical protein [Candidatus Brachybacter algidus]
MHILCWQRVDWSIILALKKSTLKIDRRKEGNFDYFVGAELGLFFIKDMHKNSEYYLSGGYMLESKSIFGELGIRTFLNTLYSRR